MTLYLTRHDEGAGPVFRVENHSGVHVSWGTADAAEAGAAAVLQEDGHECSDKCQNWMPIIRENDVVVRVVPGGNYVVLRVDAVGDQKENLGAQVDKDAALRLACEKVTGEERVFLYPQPDSPMVKAVTCPQPS